jgi:hypothetical protein
MIAVAAGAMIGHLTVAVEPSRTLAVTLKQPRLTNPWIARCND